MRPKGEAVSEILGFLADIAFFSKLSEASLLSLAQACRFMHVEKGGILFFQSDPSESAYIVRTGSISIILNSLDGREMVINEMHNGDLFGELGILTKKPRSTSAIALSTVIKPRDLPLLTARPAAPATRSPAFSNRSGSALGGG